MIEVVNRLPFNSKEVFLVIDFEINRTDESGEIIITRVHSIIKYNSWKIS